MSSLIFTDIRSQMQSRSLLSQMETHTSSHSVHSAISAPSTSRLWMMPSRLFPLLTAFTQQLWSPSVKCVSVPSSTNSPCIRKSQKHIQRIFFCSEHSAHFFVPSNEFFVLFCFFYLRLFSNKKSSNLVKFYWILCMLWISFFQFKLMFEHLFYYLKLQ